MLRTLTLLLCALWVPLAFAAPVAPDPARLAADWWTYFSPEEPLDEAGLKERVDTLDLSLEKLQKQLESDKRNDVLPAVARLRKLMADYTTSREQKAILRDALPPPQEAYTLDEAFSRHEALLSLEKEIANQEDESNWRRDLLAAERRQQSRAKVAYLAMTETDPKRTEAGLALMASRFQIELDALDVDRRHASLAQLTEQRDSMRKEIDGIAARLQIKPEEAEVWQKVRAKALAEAASFKDGEVAPANSSSTTPTGNTHRARLDALRILQRDLRVKTAELLAARAEVLTELIRFTTTQDPAPDTLRGLLAETDDTLQSLAPRQHYWKNAVKRVQETLDADEAASGPDDRQWIKEGHRLVTEVKKANAAVGLESQRLTFANELAEQRMRLGESAIQRGWTETLDIVKAGLEGTHALFSASLFEINETPVTLFGLLRVVFFLTAAWLLSKFLRHGLQGIAARRAAESVSQSSLYTLGRVMHYVILAIGILIGLSSIGIDFTKFALLASALGIGIGFGMQALVSNFVAGLIILFEKSLKVGDFVELQSGVAGEVKEINMRSTLITTNDNVDILVPNSDFINKEVTNWTLRDAFRRMRISFGVAYGSDKETVKKAALEAADAVRWTLKDKKARTPQVWLVKFGDSSLDFELVVWLIPEAVKRPAGVQAAYLWEIESKLHQYGIEIPFPQRDLHLRSGFEHLRPTEQPALPEQI